MAVLDRVEHPKCMFEPMLHGNESGYVVAESCRNVESRFLKKFRKWIRVGSVYSNIYIYINIENIL